MTDETEQKFDVDDPTTWPMEVDGHARTAAPEEAPAQADAKEDVQPQGSADANPADASGGGAAAADEQTADGVLTRDGKHMLPFDVLANTRKQAQQNAVKLSQQEAENARLRAQLEQRQGGGEASDDGDGEGEAGQATSAPIPDQAPVAGSLEDERATVAAEVAEVQTYIAENADDDELVGLAKRNLGSLRRELRRLETEITVQDRVRQEKMRSDDEQVEQAIASSPLLQAWEADTDDTWHKRALQVHTAALQANPDYGDLSWKDRFTRLPAMVEAMYGPSPHRASIKAVGDVGNGRAKTNNGGAPLSMSHIPGGEAPSPTARSVDDLLGLDQAEQRRQFKSMSTDKVEDFLFDLPVGNLNTG